MTIYAYDPDYLAGAQHTLAQMLDYAVNDCGLNIDWYYQLFAGSLPGMQFAHGSPKYIAGMSGPELAAESLSFSGEDISMLPSPAFRPDRTPQYWCGWVLARYQWQSALSFVSIGEEVSCSELIALYHPLHEAPEEKVMEVLHTRHQNAMKSTSMLKRLRQYAQLTQAQLSEKSGVSLRSIQMYEEQRKDINKAQALTVFRLAGALGCQPQALLDPGNSPDA